MGNSAPGRLGEIGWAFLKLGCTSFGGPIAHLGYLRDEFVSKRRWLDDAAYADLVALCQFLPGPASSQLVFALGMQRGRLPGAFLASLCFTLPSAVLMIAFAYGVTGVEDLQQAGWLHGLKLAAVAVVAQAVWGMGRTLCPDRTRITLALVAAAAALAVPGALGQILIIIAGMLAGSLLYRREMPGSRVATPGLARHHLWAAGTLIAWGALLLLLPIAAVASELRAIRIFDSFYRAGSLIFGGGHVVLPLLRAEVVPPGWIGDDAFLAGYGAAQALPGPLLTFAAYLGTMIEDGWVGGLRCLLAIFLPAWMLIGGVLPFWHLLRSKAWTQAALRGANASVVGILLAALYSPVWTGGVTSARDVALVFGAFALLTVGRVTPWLVVIGMAAVAQAWR